MGRALHQWLLATLMAMGLVAVLVALGAWLIGLPSPLALGLFAGLAEFIPVVGPVLGAVPVLLLALTQGAGHFAWALALVLAVQQLEANMITPMIQQRMVEVPPALLLFSIVAFGAVFDLAGVVLAGPLTVVALVAVRMLYQRQTLGERVTVPGEDPPGPAGAA
jgi:predicted PurR-regulated permease PerM